MKNTKKKLNNQSKIVKVSFTGSNIAISAALKNLGQVGARKLQTVLLPKNSQWLRDSGLESITLDGDSIVKLVCGNHEGAHDGREYVDR